RASGVEIGKHDELPLMGQNVGALRHEVHAAEDDVAAGGLGGHLREPVGIAAIVGKTHDFITLIVMTQDDALASQDGFRLPDAFVHGMVGEYEIVFERAGGYFDNRCCCHVNVSAFSSGREVPLVEETTPRNGDVES